MELGKRLKNSRLNRGFSLGNVADLLDTSRQTISKWEDGESYPDLETLKRLSECYTIPIDDLLEGYQERIEKVEARKLEIEKKHRRSSYIYGVNKKDESLVLLVLALMSSLIPVLGLIMVPFIIKRNKKTNTLYKFVYIVCVCCIVFNACVLFYNR